MRLCAGSHFGVAKAAFVNYNRSMQYGKLAGLYDHFMSGVDYGAWASYVAGFLPASAFIVECACGTGEISLRLAKMGYSVTASDISQDMLMEAAAKQRRQGLSAAKLRFVQMDMRSVSAHKKADAVVACCDGVNYLASLEDVDRFFRAAHAALKPGGRLLFDVSSRYKLQSVLSNNAFCDNGADAAYLWQNEYDPESKLIRMELSFFRREDGGLYERFDEVHIQRAHSVRELGNRLEKAGFKYSVYAFGGTEAPGETCERIQFVAEKS